MNDALAAIGIIVIVALFAAFLIAMFNFFSNPDNYR